MTAGAAAHGAVATDALFSGGQRIHGHALKVADGGPGVGVKTKGNKNDRTHVAALDLETVKALSELRRVEVARWMAKGVRPRFVFTTRYDQAPMYPDSVSRLWRKHADAHGLEGVRFPTSATSRPPRCSPAVPARAMRVVRAGYCPGREGREGVGPKVGLGEAGLPVGSRCRPPSRLLQ